MALIECNECGTQVSDKASKCPNCGNPLKPSKIKELSDLIKSNIVGYICLILAIVSLILAILVATEDWFDYFGLSHVFMLFLLFTSVFFVFWGIAKKILFPDLTHIYTILFVVVCVLFSVPKYLSDKSEVEAERIENEARDKERAEQEKKQQKEQARKQQEEREKYLNSEEYKAWNYVRTNLKSPSTASYVGYLKSSDELCMEITDKLDLSGLSTCIVRVDAQNAFGAMIRSDFVVFFKNGEPKCMMNVEKVEETPGYEIRGYLRARCGFESL